MQLCVWKMLAVCQAVRGFGITEASRGLGKLQELIKLVEWAKQGNIDGHKKFPLAAPRKSYAISNAQLKEFLTHSFLSICTPEQIKAKTCFCPGKFEAEELVTNKTMESQAVVAADPRNKLVVVSYRGTVTKKNWATNDDFTLTPYPGVPRAKVHHGQLLYFKSLQTASEAAALRLLKAKKYRGYTLHITGYSLGGSITAISTPKWVAFLKRNKLKNKMRSFMYSNSRPGNVAFAKYLEALPVPLIRYSRAGDVVPHLPDQSMGFVQVGAEYFQKSPQSKTIIRCANNVLEDPRCSASETKFKAMDHLFPFGEFIPRPTFC